MKRATILAVLLLTGCGRHTDHGWLGYGEGEDAFIAAPQPGWVAKLAVKRGDEVKTGDVLFTLDDTQQSAAQAQAQATIAQTRAQMAQAQSSYDYAAKEFARQTKLVRAGAGTQATLDLAKSNYQTASAAIAQARAQEAQAEAALTNASYQLSQRDVVAQTSGRVEDIYFREGEYAPAGTPVISVLPPQNVYVRFFIPESQLDHVHMGDKVLVTCDGCGKGLRAAVTFIAQQEEFTPPVIFSIGNREKLVFKAEARAPGGLDLNPGQPVEVKPLP